MDIHKTLYLIVGTTATLFITQIASAQGFWIKIAQDKIKQGYQAYEQRQYGAAVNKWEEALLLLKKRGPKDQVAILFNDLGLAYAGLEEYGIALIYYQKSINLKREIGDSTGIALSLGNIGIAYDHLAEYSLALDSYQYALKIVRKNGERNIEAGILENLGLIYDIIGDYSRSLSYFSRALEIAEEAGIREREGAIQGNLGVVYKNLGDSTRALGAYRKAFGIAKEEANKEAMSGLLINIGSIHRDFGAYAEALNHFQQAYDIAMALRERISFLRAVANIGYTYFQQGKFEEALAKYKEMSSGNDLHLAMVYNKLGEFKSASEYFAKALDFELKRDLKTFEVLIPVHLGMGESLEGLSRNEEAIANYLSAIKAIEGARSKLRMEEQRQSFLGTKLQPYEKMICVLYKLNSKRKQLPDTLKNWGKSNAEIAFHFAEKAKSRSLVEMLAKVRTEKLTYLLPEPLAKKEARLTAYWGNLESQIDQAFEKGKEAQQVLAQKINETRTELEAIIAQIKKDYPDYAALRYPEAITVAKLPLQDNERLLEYQVTEDATYLFVVRKGKVDKFLKIPISRKDLEDKVRHFRIAFEKLEKFEDLNRFNPLEAQELYNLLVAPALEGLDRNQHLILVPDGPLHLLPFEALVVDTTNATKMINPQIDIPSYQGITYLDEQWEVSYYQSATVLALNRAVAKKKPSWQKSLFAVADPIFSEADPRWQGKLESTAPALASTDLKDNRGVVIQIRCTSTEIGESFRRLSETREEVLTIAKLYGVNENSPDIKLGLLANEKEIKQADLTPYQNIIFATHGILGTKVSCLQQPALVLTQVDQGEEDGFLTMDEVLGLRLNADLVTLSACETGLGKQIKGEGVVGLSRAFMYAGTKSLLVSLWSVSNNSTEAFMKTFYGYVKKGKSKAEALRLAKQELRNGRFEIDDPQGIAIEGKAAKILVEGSHPFFWAPFVLIGEWE